MTKVNGKTVKSESSEELKNENPEAGFLLQFGEIIQTAIVSVLDGSSTVFRSVIGTVKDSAIFVVRSTKEVTDEVGKNFKSSTLNTIEGSHEVTVKAANTFGKTLVDLSQCLYDTGSKVGTIAKSAALNTIRGTAEVGEELFGKIKSGVGGVIPLDRIRFGRKKIVGGGSVEAPENN